MKLRKEFFLFRWLKLRRARAWRKEPLWFRQEMRYIRQIEETLTKS
jgi:hypothetical protein